MTRQENLQEESRENPAEKLTQKPGDPFWGICLTLFIGMAAGSMWAVSYFGTKIPATPVTDVPGVFTWRPDPHRSPMDIDIDADTPGVLIGLKSAGEAVPPQGQPIQPLKQVPRACPGCGS